MRAIYDDGDIEAFDDSEVVTLQKQDRTGRWARITYKIVLSYHGGSFDGWQKQPGLNTVQGYFFYISPINILLSIKSVCNRSFVYFMSAY